MSVIFYEGCEINESIYLTGARRSSRQDNKFDPKEAEERLYKMWEEAGHFKPRAAKPTDTKDDNFCIVIPPPNVTGSLHMGHALNNTIMDALTRYNRMKGKAVLWQPGMDHAGIATQMVVERQLNNEGISRRDLGREEFVKRVWQWKGESGGGVQIAQAKAAAKAAASPEELGKAAYSGCVACHGAGGEGGIGPKLAGQGATSIADKLLRYKDGETIGAQSSLMWAQAAQLSTQDIENLSAFIDTL